MRYAAGAAAIAVNLAVFFAARMWHVASELALTGDLPLTAVQPWRPVSYMFLQVYPIHLAINLTALAAVSWWYLRRRGPLAYITVYLAGGLCGALAFSGACAVAHASHATLAGCSASVMALAGDALADRRRHIRHRYAILLLLLLITASGVVGYNPGGSVAHVAGLIAGAIAGHVASRTRTTLPPEPDPLIEKASRSGYATLSPDERRRLFEQSSHKNKK